ncbi:NlpC/P60 family protein [Pseudodesulfovibrio pelocollis]|uniref:NlpC/P60 family protein n=1 Tax=Pseudodesulfovibrio pelocollis TaxID=3051432 RepID=UPI00255A9DAE|nr:NlpC/P60 family protein [Pseudodesulfovibrio sp. SB368]
MLPAWINDYVGIPFVEDGRDLARDGGLDCWGLVRLALMKQAGIVIPELPGVAYRRGQDRRSLREFITQFDHAAIGWTMHRPGAVQPQVFDVLWLRHCGPYHYGLCVGGGWFLHVEDGCDSVAERLNTLAWKNRLIGVFRHDSRPA